MKLLRSSFFFGLILLVLIMAAGCGGKGETSEGKITLKLGPARTGNGAFLIPAALILAAVPFTRKVDKVS